MPDRKPPAQHSPLGHARTRARKGKRAAAEPVGDAERDRIRVLHARGLSCNAIAAEVGRSPSTVTRQCKRMGLSFDRSATIEAVQAHAADAKARRAKLMLDYLDDAARLRAELWEPAMMRSIGGKDNVYTEHPIDRPMFADQYQIMRASGLAFDKHLAAAEFDSDNGTAGAKNLLGDIGNALRAIADGIEQAPAGDEPAEP
jgi:AraC-like DNA-binding protein